MPAKAQNRLVTRYPVADKTRDDLSELFREVEAHGDSIERAIVEAGMYRIFFLGIVLLRDVTQPGYKFIIEYDKETKLWTVGHVWKGRRRKGVHPGYTVSRERLDDAADEVIKVWRAWAEGEKLKRG